MSISILFAACLLLSVFLIEDRICFYTKAEESFKTEHSYIHAIITCILWGLFYYIKNK